MSINLTMDFISLLQILVSVFILIQGIIVLIQNPHSNLNKSFFFFQFCVFIWMIGMGFGYFSANDSYTLILVKIGFIGVSLIPISTYIFSAYFRSEQPRKVFIIPGALLTLFIIINVIMNNPFFVKGIIKYSWGNYIHNGSGAILSVFLFAFFMYFFGKNLYESYIKAERRKRWYGLAFISGMLSFAGIVDFLPSFGLWMPIHPPGFIFVGVLSSFMGYFMIRYNLADIKLVLGRAIGHAVVIGIIGIAYILIFIKLFLINKNIEEIIKETAIFIFAIYIFNLLIKIGKRLTDEIFNKNQISFEIKINKFEKQLYRFKDLNKFFKEIFDFLEDSLRIETPFFLIINEKDRAWLMVRSSNLKIESRKIPMLYKGSMKMNSVENTKLIDTEQIFDFDEITKEAITLSKENKGIMLSPLITRLGIVGFLVFGKQVTRQSFGLKEKKALENLISAICISWENVQLFENIERENRIKMDFISISSHQLRTPLTRLKWALEMISTKIDLEDDMKIMLGDLRISTDNMISLVNQLLSVAESEKGEIIETSKSLIYPIIKEVIDKKMPEIITKKINFKFKDDEKEMEAIFSKNALIIIVETLIDNAIQYTKNGGNIEVSFHKLDSKLIEIQVADDGIGISQNEQADIFSKFFRGDNAISIRPDGTGLGLYYAKLLAEKQGGSIYFSSNKGSGSIFHITLRGI
ncbi:MAG: ATP-binding protein [Patescibacteria group bacterium]